MFESVAAMALVGFENRLNGVFYAVLEGLSPFSRERVIRARMVFLPRVVQFRAEAFIIFSAHASLSLAGLFP